MTWYPLGLQKKQITQRILFFYSENYHFALLTYLNRQACEYIYVNAQNFQWCMTSVKTEQWICGFISALSLFVVSIEKYTFYLVILPCCVDLNPLMHLQYYVWNVHTFFIGVLDFRSARDFLYYICMESKKERRCRNLNEMKLWRR